MIRFRSFLPIYIIAIFVLVVAACGDSQDTVNGEDETVDGDPPDQQAEPPEDETTDDDSTNGVAEFYAGETVRFVVGFDPGGAYDQYTRILADHLAEYIPGQPSIIVENLPGAGSAIAASAVYETEPQDGTVIATVNPYLMIQQAIGASGIEFDMRNFHWLGSGRKDTQLCAVSTDLGVDTLSDLMEDGAPEVAIGTLGPGSNTHVTPALFAEIGANITLVPGYGGSGDLEQAYLGGEIDGLCMSVNGSNFYDGSSIFPEDEDMTTVIGVLGDEVPDHPLLQDVPASNDLVDDETVRLATRVADTPNQVSISWGFGPDVPQDRVTAMRQAFQEALADPDLVATFEDVGRALEPSTGDEVSAAIEEALNAPPDLIERLRDLFED